MKRLLIILFASFCLSPHLGLAAAPSDLPPNVKTLRVNGYDMAYTEQGSGPPLILVHGSLSDYRTWAPVLADLRTENRVIALSLRGSLGAGGCWTKRSPVPFFNSLDRRS
ncbi:MAG: hypothetical protein KJ946_01755 [Gammaproteobacteria bacterium]|jgi:hypothetical protein|nr:hypothetical protein [Gammaproteobacteria bacterium]